MLLEGKVDLHFHTECSGDSYIPLYAVMPAAERLGLAAVAKTDHDSVTGCTYLADAARGSQVEYIPAVELSTAEHWHTLGYFVDPENPGLVSYCEKEKEYGRRLLRANVHAWKEAGGALPDDLDRMLEDVRSLRPIGEISLKQVSDHLAGRGFYPDTQSAREDAAERLEGFTPPGNVPPPAEQAVKTIMEAGGVAVFAHPKPSRVEHVERLLAAGAVGVGGLNVKALSADERRFWLDYCRENDLVITGGTDHHGPVESWNIAYQTVADYECVGMLKGAVKRVHGRTV